MPLLWDAPTHSLPPLSPILPISSLNQSPSRKTRRLISAICRGGALSFFLIATACLSTGYLALVLWSGRQGSLADRRCSSIPPLVSCPGSSTPHLISSALQLGSSAPPPQRKHDDDYLGLEELRDVVAKTKGYFVRDYSLALGWNNVRCYRHHKFQTYN
jgi:hypothetical protein